MSRGAERSTNFGGVNNDGIARSATLGSVANAARVLKAFTPTEREWGVTDLARRLRIAKSTAHRLLATLTDEALLEQDPTTGRYRLGLVIFDLAAAAQSVDLHEAVMSPMTSSIRTRPMVERWTAGGSHGGPERGTSLRIREVRQIVEKSAGPG